MLGQRIRIVCVVGMLVATGFQSATVFANSPPPRFRVPIGNADAKRASKPDAIPMKVTKSDAKVTRIKIPANLLAKGNNKLGLLLPGLDSPDGAVESLAVRSASSNAAEISTTGSLGTIIAGLAFTVAAGCAFVIFGKRISNNKLVVTAAITLIAGFCFVGGATADFPLPDGTYAGDNRPPHFDASVLDPFQNPTKPSDQNSAAQNNAPAVVAENAAKHKIIVEIVSDGKSVELALGSDATWAK